jgi:hypothetical protein
MQSKEKKNGSLLASRKLICFCSFGVPTSHQRLRKHITAGTLGRGVFAMPVPEFFSSTKHESYYPFLAISLAIENVLSIEPSFIIISQF